MKYCVSPFHGMTIHADGKLGLCCSQNRTWDIGHISEVDDLNDNWQNNDKIESLRYEDDENRKLACGNCLRYKNNGGSNKWTEINNPKHYLSKIPHDNKLRYLEFTTSNICNQACISCSSFFSTKWIDIEDQAVDMGFELDKMKTSSYGFGSFGFKQYRMNDTDIQKIKKLLPDLHHIYIKGGEPFADKHNFDILDDLIKINPKCHIHFTSNFSKVPDKFIRILKGAEKVIVNCSIDGIGDVYKYIRSTPFNQTVDNIKRWRDEGIPGILNVSYNISAYNFYHTIDYLKWFEENLVSEVDYVKIASWIRAPQYIAPVMLFNDEMIHNNINDIMMLDLPQPKFRLQFLKTKVSHLSPKDEIFKTQFHQYTRFMNIIRGMDIYDIYPKLRDI